MVRGIAGWASAPGTNTAAERKQSAIVSFLVWCMADIILYPLCGSEFRAGSRLMRVFPPGRFFDITRTCVEPPQNGHRVLCCWYHSACGLRLLRLDDGNGFRSRSGY